MKVIARVCSRYSLAKDRVYFSAIKFHEYASSSGDLNGSPYDIGSLVPAIK